MAKNDQMEGEAVESAEGQPDVNNKKPLADRPLVVVHAFGDYRRGDSITDPSEVAAVLASENANHCRKVIPQ